MPYDKKTLEKLILEENKTYEAIGKIYNVSGNAIKRAAQRLGINTPKRREINPKENFVRRGFKSTSLVNRITDEVFIKIIQNNSTWKDISKELGYKNSVLSGNVKDSIIARCTKLGIVLNIADSESILNRTKGELFESRKNWQSARSGIRKSANQIYRDFYPSPKCAICGYNKHVEVAHIKAVSEFDNNTTIREINSIDNLIGLCPNHHWEYDNGILNL